MAASAYFDQVQKLYIAYFGRPADPVGLAYWAASVDAANGNFSAAIAGFSSSNESNALYAGTSTSQKVSAIYLAIFNRNPEPAGLSYWVGLIDSGTVSSAQAAYTILNSAGVGDSSAVANKLAAANAFTAQIDTMDETVGYVGQTAAAYGRAFLNGVDATPASLSTATAFSNLTNTVAIATNTTTATPPTTPTGPGQTFTLTAGVDIVNGTALDDSIVSTVAGGFASGDSIDGGAGTDTLTVSGSGKISSAGVTVTGVESATFTSLSDVSLNTTTWIGLTSLTTQSNAGASTITAGAGTAIVSSALNQGASNITINGGSNVSVSSSAGTGGAITIGSTTQATGAVKVDATSGSTSGSMGPITITGGSVINVTQSAGNALNTTVTMGTITVNGKAGTTSVNVNNAARANADVGTAGVDNNAVAVYDINSGSAGTKVGTITNISVKNYTVVGIQDNVLSNLSLTGGSGNIIIDNSSSIPSASITRTLNLTADGLTGGTLDDADLYTTLNVTTTGANSTLANITFGGLSNLIVSGTKNLTLISTAGATALNAVTVSGAAGLTANFGSTSTLKSVDASASSGAVTLTIDGTKASYSGGSGVDTLTLTNSAAPTKVISGGAGSNDVLSLTAISAAALSNAALISGFEQVTLTGATNQTVDVSNFVGAMSFSTLGGNGLTLNKLVTGNSLILTGAGTAYTLNGDGFAAGSNDTLNLTLTSKTGAAVAFASTGITTTSVETISISTFDGQGTPSGTFNDSVTLLGNALKTITVSGNAGLALTASSTGLTSVDASGITSGGFTWTSGATSGPSLTVKGSASGTNTVDLHLANATATYLGGSGADTITGSVKADSFTLGAGANVVKFAPAQFTATDTNSLILAADAITDWSTGGGINTIDFTASLAKVDHSAAAVSGTASITNGLATFFSDATTLTAKLAAVVNAVNTDAAGTAVMFTDGANSYLFVVGDATAGVQSGDALIKIVGVVATGLTINAGGDLTGFI
ncbi:S-layer protein [Pseudomonas sp. JUb42]|uniref:beta strand repeat-containing protein n=1 Tax=Pseudomonas sp. JUb42 TaxID=2940611 RepID=UPI00216A4D97|nr:DUF4214 domain-containing protein [Pseudomonas sp. JUb42]MCS3469939.1 S-layer protein [Pseudomonas sp. JUb42]